MQFVFNDGGRAAAGFKGQAGDCVTRSISIATGLPYREVYDALNTLARRERRGKNKTTKSSARSGVYTATVRKYMKSIGWQWCPTRSKNLPSGRLVIAVAGHYTAVIDDTLHDTFDCRSTGSLCIYGYYLAYIK